MLTKLLSTLALKLLTERVIINVSLACLDYLAVKTTNQLDDKIVAEVKKALKVE
jgi:hypothetical protein